MEIFDSIVSLMAHFVTLCFELTEKVGYPSYGLAIILMTIIIKVALTPLTIKQVRSMKGMAKLQPHMKRIQERYKDDPARLQSELQKLYSEMGVNPMAGCLPMLIQMPFLIAIFYALKDYPYIPAYESFLWLPSLGAPDPLYILPVLSAVTTYLVSMQTTSKNADKQQKTLMFIMPVIIGYISLQFPSGLVIYWAMGNLVQYIQQFIVFRGDED